MFGALNKAQVDQTLGDVTVFSGRSGEGGGMVLEALPWPAMSGESVYHHLHTYGSGFCEGWAVSFCRCFRGVLVWGRLRSGIRFGGARLGLQHRGAGCLRGTLGLGLGCSELQKHPIYPYPI